MRARLVVTLTFVAAAAMGLAAQDTPQQTTSGFGAGAYRPGSGVTDPVVLKEQRPNYTSDAMRARIQGVVELEAVILPNGTVGDVRVVQSLDTVFGLDREAVIAAKKWLFKPGSLNGNYVPVIVTLVLEFRLNNPPPPQIPQPITSGFGAGAYRPGPGLTYPVVIKEQRPVYTAAALQAGIQGTVELEAVVQPDGTVGDVRVTKSLDAQYGLDAAAIVAAKAWLFKPAYLERAGSANAVPMLITLVLEFRQKPTDNSPAQAQVVKPDEEFEKGAYRVNTPGITAPVLLVSAPAKYTMEALRNKVNGVVELEAVVAPSGLVDRVRITKSLDVVYGLDDEAIKAVKAYRFQPATLAKVEVPVIVTLVVEFRIH